MAGQLPQLSAILSWNGAPDFPELRVLVDEAPVQVGGRRVEDRVDLMRTDTVKVGGFELKFDYPRV